MRDLAGYSFGRSDIVRRAMSKKKKDVMMEEKQYFIYGKEDAAGNVEIPGCVRNGISAQAAEAIFADMETFAQYAFNKSHAAAYAVVAYETGYLKKYYPVEFMAALLSSVMGDTAQTSRYIRNCEEMGIRVLPPDINESDHKYTVVDGKIRYGLRGVKNVGDNAIENIIEARKKWGPPRDIFQFIDHIDVTVVNKKAVESLIKAGALDCLSPNRAAHLAVYESVMSSAQNAAKKNVAGQLSLFDLSSEAMNSADVTGKLPNVRNFPQKTLLALEKEMLGIYITGHPLNAYADRMKRLVTATSRDLQLAAEGAEAEDGSITEGGMELSHQESQFYDGQPVVMAGQVAGRKTLITKNNKMMAFVDLEDLYGMTEVVVFPNVYERCQEALVEDKVVLIRGKLNYKEGEVPKLLADRIDEMDDPGEGDAPGAQGPAARTGPADAESAGPGSDMLMKVRIPPRVDERVLLDRIAEVFHLAPGPAAALIYLQNGKVVRNRAGVDPSEYVVEELKSLVGPGNVKVERKESK